MREIKFRAWDKKKKRMYYPQLLWHNDFIMMANVGMKEGELMQFTGLKDKNGKEIYSDFIINAPGHCGVAVVKEGRAAWMVGGWYLGQIDEADIEVIGNIYENPELLKQK